MENREKKGRKEGGNNKVAIDEGTKSNRTGRKRLGERLKDNEKQMAQFLLGQVEWRANRQRKCGIA